MRININRIDYRRHLHRKLMIRRLKMLRVLAIVKLQIKMRGLFRLRSNAKSLIAIAIRLKP
jgi:hypothetical protein